MSRPVGPFSTLYVFIKENTRTKFTRVYPALHSNIIDVHSLSRVKSRSHNNHEQKLTSGPASLRISVTLLSMQTRRAAERRCYTGLC